MKQNKGFTLLELMIVIAIIGIVASISIPAYTGYMTNARMSEAKNNITALQLAEEEFFLENNTYCYDNSNDNTNLSAACGALWTATGGEGNDINFTYTVSGSGTSYHITATGNIGTPVAGRTEEFSKN